MLEFNIVSSGCGSPYQDVVLRGIPSQQDLKYSEQRHERSGVLALSKRLKPLVRFRAQIELNAFSTTAALGRTRVICRQLQDCLSAPQHVRPIITLNCK